jgi:hypothetical protein
MKAVWNGFAITLFVLVLVAWGGPEKQPGTLPAARESTTLANAVQPVELEATQPSGQAGINITQAQYDEALAKWRAAAISEYEIVVEYQAFSFYAGTFTLLVEGGEVVEVISFERGGRGAGTPLPNPADLKFLTIETAFARVGEALATKPWDINGSESKIPLDYMVEFDPALGYPSLLQVTALPNPISNLQISDADSSTRVLSVKKAGSVVIPGMPRTGAHSCP